MRKSYSIKKRKKSKNKLNRNIRSKKKINTRYKKRRRSFNNKKNKKIILRGGMEGSSGGTAAVSVLGLDDPLTTLKNLTYELDQLNAMSYEDFKTRLDQSTKTWTDLYDDIKFNVSKCVKEEGKYTQFQKDEFKRIQEELVPKLKTYFVRGSKYAGERTAMQSFAQKPKKSQPKPKPNKPCPCGSGKKHKKCCGAHA